MSCAHFPLLVSVLRLFAWESYDPLFSLTGPGVRVQHFGAGEVAPAAVPRPVHHVLWVSVRAAGLPEQAPVSWQPLGAGGTGGAGGAAAWLSAITRRSACRLGGFSAREVDCPIPPPATPGLFRRRWGGGGGGRERPQGNSRVARAQCPRRRPTCCGRAALPESAAGFWCTSATPEGQTARLDLRPAAGGQGGGGQHRGPHCPTAVWPPIPPPVPLPHAQRTCGGTRGPRHVRWTRDSGWRQAPVIPSPPPRHPPAGMDRRRAV